MIEVIRKELIGRNYWNAPGFYDNTGEKLIDIICRLLNVKQEDLFSKEKHRRKADARMVFRWGLVQFGWSYCEIAQYMNNCSASNVCQGLKRIAELEQTDKNIKRIMSIIRNKIEKNLIVI